MPRLATKNEKRKTLIADYASLMGGAVLRHRADVAERAKRVEAERAGKVISQFVTNMSHELRTPLNAIIGFSEFMQDIEKHGLNKESIEEYSRFIYGSSTKLLNIVNNIIDISKIHSGSMIIDPQEISVAEILQPSIRLAAGEAADGRTISEKIAPGLPPIFVDIVKMKQVFRNILENAVETAPEGGTVAVSAEKAADGFVKIAFSNGGRSMSGDESSSAESERDWERAGLGIGLAIAEALVELHKGRMTLSGRDDPANEVAVILPACPGAPDIERRGRADAAQTVENA